MPVLFGLLIIFAVWFRYQSKKSARNSEQKSSDFWKAEQDANFTRRADIDRLDYITIPLDKLPLTVDGLPGNALYRERILALSEVRMLNLTGITNTDLKSAYGPANMELLSSYDENFTALCRLLNEWASFLYEEQRYEEAVSVLTFAVSCKSDIGAGYVLLAKLYKEKGDIAAIDSLMQSLDFFDSYRLPSLQKSISAVRNS